MLSKIFHSQRSFPHHFRKLPPPAPLLSTSNYVNKLPSTEAMLYIPL